VDKGGPTVVPECFHDGMHGRIVRVIPIEKRMELHTDELLGVEEPRGLGDNILVPGVGPHECVHRSKFVNGALDEGVVGMKHNAVVDAGFPHRGYQTGPIQGYPKHRKFADMHV
jgi:hypothetical protein